MRRVLQWGLLFLLFGGWIAFYGGFYRVDPYVLGRYPLIARTLLVVFRVGIPLLTALIIGFILAWRKGGLRLAEGGLFFSVFFVCLILGFVAVGFVYRRTFEKRPASRQYHPFLQLVPRMPDPERLGRKGIHVFCLGGSTTEFTDPEGHGWTDRAEALLTARLGTPVILHNMGRQWYTTLHTLIHFSVNLRPLHPDVVLVMHTINDLLPNADFSYFSLGPFREDYGHFAGPVTRLAKREGFLDFTRGLLSGLWYHQPRETVRTTEFPGLSVFRRNLETLIDLAERDGILVVLMTQPTLLKETMDEAERAACYMVHYEAIGPDRQWDISTAAEGMRQYTEAIRRLSEERQIPLIDLERSVPKRLAFFTDEVHYTPQGFDRVGEQVAEGLLPILTTVVKARP